jgi:hypothetical protein
VRGELQTWWTWIADELNRSAVWRAHVKWRREQARKPHRSGDSRQLGDYESLPAVQKVRNRHADTPRKHRSHVWSDDRADDHTRTGVPDQEYPVEYARPQLSPGLPPLPAPTGPQASLAATHVTGASWGKPGARRQAFRRAAPRHLDESYFSVELVADYYSTARLRPEGDQRASGDE